MPDYKIAIKTTADLTGQKQTVTGLDQIKGKLADVQIAGTTLGAAMTNGPAAAAAVLVAAGGAFLAFAKSSIEAAEEEAQALAVLNSALEATAQFSVEAAEGIGKLADEQERATNVSGETWTEAAARLIQYGARVEEIPELFPILEGLAGRMGGDVAGAARALGMALAGQTRGLAQFGVQIADGASKVEILAKAQEIAAKGQGVLRGQAATLTGETIALGNAWGEVKTEFGKSITQGGELAKAVGVVTKAVLYLRDNMDGVLKFSRETLAGLTLGFSETALTALGWGKDVKKASEDVTDATEPVEGFTKANQGAKDALEEMQKAAEEASLKAYIEQLKEANKQLQLLEERNTRLAKARAEQEQGRIAGLVKAGLLSPEEGARQQEAAEIEAERAALTTDRDRNVGALLRAAGEKATLQDDSQRPGANQEDIAKLIKANEFKQQQARTAIEEAAIRLETNRQRAAAAEAANAVADTAARRAAREESAPAGVAADPRAELLEKQQKAFAAASPDERIEAIARDAGGVADGAAPRGDGTVAGSVAQRVRAARDALLNNGRQPGEAEELDAALTELLEVGRLLNSEQIRAKRDQQLLREEVRTLAQQVKNNRA